MITVTITANSVAELRDKLSEILGELVAGQVISQEDQPSRFSVGGPAPDLDEPAVKSIWTSGPEDYVVPSDTFEKPEHADRKPVSIKEPIEGLPKIESTRRRRRTKAEMAEARAELEARQARGLHVPDEAPQEDVFEEELPKQVAQQSEPVRFTREHVQQALQEVTAEFGLVKSKEILASFASAKMSDLTEEQIQPFVLKCREVLKSKA